MPYEYLRMSMALPGNANVQVPQARRQCVSRNATEMVSSSASSPFSSMHRRTRRTLSSLGIVLVSILIVLTKSKGRLFQTVMALDSSVEEDCTVVDANGDTQACREEQGTKNVPTDEAKDNDGNDKDDALASTATDYLKSLWELNPMDFVQQQIFGNDSNDDTDDTADDLWDSLDAMSPHGSKTTGKGGDTTQPNDESDWMSNFWDLLLGSSLTAETGQEDSGDSNKATAPSDWEQVFFTALQHEHQQQEQSSWASTTTLGNFPTQSWESFRDTLTKAVYKVRDQLNETFASSIALERFHLLQLYYATMYEESQKNAVWKRQRHAFLPSLPIDVAVGLSDGLYLSQMSYLDTCSDIQEYVSSFHKGNFALVNCTTKSQPHRPAHFVMIQRQRNRKLQDVEQNPDTPYLKSLVGGLLEKAKQKATGQEGRTLDVVLVVRGTKELGDILSDATLAPVSFNYQNSSGWAHEGIYTSAQWIFDLYGDFFQTLRQTSKSKTLKLRIIGHSLGGGTAALASMVFNDPSKPQNEGVRAQALGFGTPAVLSKELSESIRDTVTTVACDADAVVRMSGATLANAWLRIVQYNWTMDALRDFDQIFNVIRENVAPIVGNSIFSDEMRQKAIDMLQRALQQAYRPLDENTNTDPLPVQLYPPGECVHLYRDGVEWQGNYYPCHRFNEMEVVRHMIDDHLIPTGYYPALINFIRSKKNDFHWRFEHDLLDLPIQ